MHITMRTRLLTQCWIAPSRPLPSKGITRASLTYTPRNSRQSRMMLTLPLRALSAGLVRTLTINPGSVPLHLMAVTRPAEYLNAWESRVLGPFVDTPELRAADGPTPQPAVPIGRVRAPGEQVWPYGGDRTIANTEPFATILNEIAPLLAEPAYIVPLIPLLAKGL